LSRLSSPRGSAITRHCREAIFHRHSEIPKANPSSTFRDIKRRSVAALSGIRMWARWRTQCRIVPRLVRQYNHGGHPDCEQLAAHFRSEFLGRVFSPFESAEKIHRVLHVHSLHSPESLSCRALVQFDSRAWRLDHRDMAISPHKYETSPCSRQHLWHPRGTPL
jgi:hypothetical protein